MSSGEEWKALALMAAKLAGGAALVLVGVAIVLPAISAPRVNRHDMRDVTKTRGIQQSLVIYAQTNNQQFPGLDRDGNPIAATVEGRYQLLLDDDYFAGEYAISSAEQKPEWTGGTVTTANYSFALSAIGGARSVGRREAWTANEAANQVVVSNRNTGSDAGRNVQSVHTQAPGKWRGAVSYNDGHADLLNTQIVGDDDNLFVPADTGDAFQIPSGE